MEESRYFGIPAQGISLFPDEVQVWLETLEHGATHAEQFFRTLSADEQDRALRFHFEKDRVRFVTARGILRQLLGTLLRIDPDRVCFQFSEYGKPFLADQFSSSGLKFNVSHSGDKMLIAISARREIGIDVEKIRPDFSTEEIAERYFSAFEVARFRSLPDEVRSEAFFSCWTRKEAYIKAIGNGLSCPLDEFDVTFAPGEPAGLLAVRGHAFPASAWAMHDLDVGPGYKAALVAEGNDWRLNFRDWCDRLAMLQNSSGQDGVSIDRASEN